MSKINPACAHRHTHTPTRFRSLPKMSGLSSMRISPVINVLSLVRMTCSRKSWPKCFSTQAYWTHTHTHMHSWWDLIRERKHGNNLQRKQNRCCWLGGGGLTFSYGQCLYCFIGLVQIKTSVLRRETETTGPEWKKLKTYKHLDIPAAQTWQTHWLFITGMNDYFGDGQRAFNGRTSEKHEIAPYGRFPR